MKKAVITVVSAVLIALTATGCGAPTENAESEIVMPAYTSEWPVNEYTEEIPRPESGEVFWIYDDSENGRFGISLNGITWEESEQYIGRLKSCGYSELFFDEKEHVSAGTMLQRGDVTLNVSYSEYGLGILISIGSA